jgi:ankyrin repeat protein
MLLYDHVCFQGANTNCTNKDGLPVLHVASINRHVDAIPVLVQAGADVNKKGPT